MSRNRRSINGRRSPAGWRASWRASIGSRRPIPGRVTARRLNRAEYNNTVRDLLGVDMHPADDFPQDDSGYGFDNIGDVLSLSPALMEKYFAAAEKVTRAALFGPPKLAPTLDPSAIGRSSSGRGARRSRRHTTSPGLSLPNAFHAIYRVPVDGEYAVRIVLGGTRPAALGADHGGLVGGRARSRPTACTILIARRRSPTIGRTSAARRPSSVSG